MRETFKEVLCDKDVADSGAQAQSDRVASKRECQGQQHIRFVGHSKQFGIKFGTSFEVPSLTCDDKFQSRAYVDLQKYGGTCRRN
jgi:hypothetical protein